MSSNQLTFTGSKLIMKTPKNVIDVVRLFLIGTLNRFHTLF